MSNKHHLRIIVIRILLVAFCQHVKYSRGYDGWECQCDCVYDTPKQPRCSRNQPTPETYIARIKYNHIPECIVQNYTKIPLCDGDINGIQPCSYFIDCCFEEDILDVSSIYIPGSLILCSNGPDRLCDSDDCYLPTAQNCICNYVYYDVSTTPKTSTNEQSTTHKNHDSGFAIGLGVGIGICVFIAANIALLVYCRLKGRGEGQGKAEGTLPMGTLPSTDANRQGDNEEYAEIDPYVGDATMRAVANQAYSSSDVVITPDQANQAYTSLNDPAINSHQYKSLKKPNQDLGSGEYADPEKYTEPPVLPQRNSNAIDDEEDDEDYVSQGTPEPATNNDDSRDDYTLEPTAPSTYNINSSAQSNPKEVPTPSSDYVSVDTPDHPSPISPSSDYVSVDSPDNDTEENDISSDYVDF